MGVQGRNRLIGQLLKRKKSGAAEFAPLFRALPATTMGEEEKKQKLTANLSFVTNATEAMKAKFLDSPHHFLYHLEVLVATYVMVSCEGKEWLDLQTAQKYLMNFKKMCRADAKYSNDSFELITSCDMKMRQEWRKKTQMDPTISLSEIIPAVENQFQALFPSDATMKDNHAKKTAMVQKPGPYSKWPQTKKAKEQGKPQCRNFASGNCQWGKSCRFRHD